ncbi:MAG: hypothetical protein U1D30_14980 [Planctomycetota bacterium]
MIERTRVFVLVWIALHALPTWGAPIPSHSLPALEPVPVSVEDGKSVTIDLEGGATERQFLVILGSLSLQDSAHTVRVTATPISTVTPLPVAQSSVDAKWLASVSAKRQQMQARRQISGGMRSAHVAARFPEKKSFFVFVKEDDFFDRESYQEVVGQLVAVGRECLVYVDEEDGPASFPNDVIDEIVNTYDQIVYPRACQLFGSHHDIDRNGKFTILLTHWLGNLSNGKVSLGGFVRGSDFLPDLAAPFSNQCDMMYLNSNVRPGEHLRTLIAHEYTHAVTYSEHVFGDYLVGGGGEDEETWLSEAMAHLAENFAETGWSNLDYRISTYLNAPDRYRLVVPDYYRSGLWRCHGSRGSTYLFLRWCVDQYGPELLQELSRSGLIGLENLEVATQTPFAELFRAWSVSICTSGMSSSENKRGLEYLSLHGRLATRLLAGPRIQTLGGETCECQLLPTSWCPLMVRVPAGKSVRYRMEAPQSTKLQVTLLRVPDDYPHATLDLRPVSSGESGVERVSLRLEHQIGCAVVWKRMTIEPTYLPQTKSPLSNFVPTVLDLEDMVEHTRTSCGETLQSAESIAVPDVDGEFVIKVHGVDAAGREVSAWGTLRGRSASTPGEPRVVARETEAPSETLAR